MMEIYAEVGNASSIHVCWSSGKWSYQNYIRRALHWLEGVCTASALIWLPFGTLISATFQHFLTTKKSTFLFFHF